MSNKNEIVIKDACILFDLVDLNLLEDFFRLQLVAYTTPQVMGEITNEEQWNEISKYVQNGYLIIDGDGQFETITGLHEEHAGLSIADSSVLELAIRKKAVIFSSDGSLRKISTARNLTVRGVLWIIDELFNEKLITSEKAMAILKIYQEVNQRAPLKEIQNLIHKISKIPDNDTG